VLGDGVSVGAYCVLRNMTIGAGTEILPFSHLEDSAAGTHCRIGPFSHLRPGAKLADEVHVGNFVEIKASTLDMVPRPIISPTSATPRSAPRQLWRGRDHRQLRWREQAPHGDWRPRAHRQQLRAGGAGDDRRGRDDRRRQHHRADAPPDALTFARPPQVTKPGWKRPVKQSKKKD